MGHCTGMKHAWSHGRCLLFIRFSHLFCNPCSNESHTGLSRSGLSACVRARMHLAKSTRPYYRILQQFVVLIVRISLLPDCLSILLSCVTTPHHKSHPSPIEFSASSSCSSASSMPSFYSVLRDVFSIDFLWN